VSPRRYRIRKVTPLKTPTVGKEGSPLISDPFVGDDDGELESGVEALDTDPEIAKEVHLFRILLGISEQPEMRGETKKVEMSASDPAVLGAFLKSSIDKNPAKDARQLVILSGHGSGAVGSFLKSNNPPSSLAIKDLQIVFEKVRMRLKRKIDIVLMDSCLMGMAEVAFELKDSADFLIGAEGFELSTGWPYHRIMESLNEVSQRGANAKSLALELARKYVLYYSDYDVAGVSVDQAVFDLSQTQYLIDAITKLRIALMEEIVRERDAESLKGGVKK